MADKKTRPQPISQLDFGEVLRNSHDFDGSNLRVRDTIATVQDYFTHYRATYNVDSNPTKITYYLGTQPHKSDIGVVSDVAGSLNNTYFTINDARTEQKYHVWYNVSGGGTDPAPVGSTPIEVAIVTNEDSTIVALATELAINTTAPLIFDSRRTGNAVVRITNKRFGTAPNTVNGTTAFFISNTIGAQSVVETVCIDYNGTNPIWEGEELIGYSYNIFTGKFHLNPEVTVISEVDLQHPTSFEIINLAIATKNVEVSQTLPDDTKRYKIQVRDDAAKLRLAHAAGETTTKYETIDRGFIWDSFPIDPPNSTDIYLQSSRDSITVEIHVWKRA